MNVLTNLAVEYERAFTEIKMDRFAELMDSPRDVFTATKEKQIKLSEYLIGIAYERNIKGLNGEMTFGVLDDLMNDLEQRGEGIISGASKELASALKNKVSKRVEHYQDLLVANGQFDNWEDFLIAKYGDGMSYREAVDRLTLSERIIIPFEEEILRLTNASALIVSKRPITQSVYASAYARRRIAETVFKLNETSCVQPPFVL